MKKIVFLTGTRADFGKMKPLIRACENSMIVESYVYVSGMHLLSQYGNTYRDVKSEKFKNIALQPVHRITEKMDINLSNLVFDFSKYINDIKPHLIIVHGDRIDALSGAIVAMLNGILLGHIEGGEITGTVDEAIRHAISKMANLHFVSNEESLIRLNQLGEDNNHIFVIGSPDIDIMLSKDLPNIKAVKEKYKIEFKKYAILLHHPVTTEVDNLSRDMDEILTATNESDQNYLVIYPNNDTGSEVIIKKYCAIKSNKKYLLFQSIPFEDFLVLLKYSEFIIGNSSCGVREACVYGVPAIDIGTRQKNRYSIELMPNIQNIKARKIEILEAIDHINEYRIPSSYFGEGNSAKKFLKIIEDRNLWNINVQKQFLDTKETKKRIQIYHNEVCF